MRFVFVLSSFLHVSMFFMKYMWLFISALSCCYAKEGIRHISCWTWAQFWSLLCARESYNTGREPYHLINRIRFLPFMYSLTYSDHIYVPIILSIFISHFAIHTTFWQTFTGYIKNMQFVLNIFYIYICMYTKWQPLWKYRKLTPIKLVTTSFI